MKKIIIIAMLVSAVSLVTAKDFSQSDNGLNQSSQINILSKPSTNGVLELRGPPSLACRLQCAPVISACRIKYGFEACIEVGIACYKDCAES